MFVMFEKINSYPNLRLWRPAYGAHLVLVFLVLPLIFRYLFYRELPLHPDEAYYWTWTQRLSWSYYDHPPMVAWLPSALAGGGPIGGEQLRLLANVCGVLTSAVLACLLFNLTRDRKSVLLFGYAMLVTPMVFVNAAIWTPDAPLCLFLALFLFSFHKAYCGKTGNRDWIWCGLWFGAALLSKYNAILWGGSAFLWVLATRSGRRHILQSGQPWLAMLLAFLIFSPVLWWNLVYSGDSFYYQGMHLLNSARESAGQGRGQSLSGGSFYLPEVLAGLLLAIGPFVVWRLVFSRQNRQFAHLAFAGYLPLIFFFALSVSNKIELNWMVFSAYILVVLFFAVTRTGKKQPDVILRGHYAFHMLILACLWVILLWRNPYTDSLLAARFFDYDSLRTKISELKEEYPDAHLMGRSYMDHAVLSYATGELLPYRHLTGRQNHYAYMRFSADELEPVILGSFRNPRPPVLAQSETAPQYLGSANMSLYAVPSPRFAFYLLDLSEETK